MDNPATKLAALDAKAWLYEHHEFGKEVHLTRWDKETGGTSDDYIGWAETPLVPRADMAEGVETIASMIQWGDETFGPCTADKAISRAWEEWQEMLERGADVPIEAADVIICLLRIPGIADAIQRKMTINRARKWRLMGDGTGYHIPAVHEASDGGGA